MFEQIGTFLRTKPRELLSSEKDSIFKTQEWKDQDYPFCSFCLSWNIYQIFAFFNLRRFWWVFFLLFCCLAWGVVHGTTFSNLCNMFFIFCLIGKIFIFLIHLEDFHLKVHSMVLRLDQVITGFWDRIHIFFQKN